MFFTKKYNYFSQATRWNHPYLSQSPLKGCFGTSKLTDGFICHRLYKFKKILIPIVRSAFWKFQVSSLNNWRPDAYPLSIHNSLLWRIELSRGYWVENQWIIHSENRDKSHSFVCERTMTSGNIFYQVDLLVQILP